MVTSAFTEKKANIKSFAFPFLCVCPSSSSSSYAPIIGEVPFTGNSPMSLLLFSLFPRERKGGGGGERKKHKTGSRRSFRSNSWRPEVMEETRTSPPLLLLPIDVCNSRRIRSPPRCTHTHGPMFPLSLLSTLVCQCFVECTRKREREREKKEK